MNINAGLVAAALVSTLNTAPDSIEAFIADNDTSTVSIDSSSSKNNITRTTSKNRIVLPPDLDTGYIGDNDNENSDDNNSPSTSSPSNNKDNNISIDPDELSKWEALAECESGGDWSINTGNGFYGGLQFTPQTWAGFGGTQYASQANQATKEQQIEIAKKVQAEQGWGAWPACTSKLGYR